MVINFIHLSKFLYLMNGLKSGQGQDNSESMSDAANSSLFFLQGRVAREGGGGRRNLALHIHGP